MIGTALGYRVELCLPQNASPERKRILKAYGAEVILTDAQQSSDGAIREARRRYAEHPERYYYVDQYSNPANWRAHYETTAPEIWAQTDGAITHFVAGLGTSGTFIGTARRLREFNAAIRLIAMQPDGPYSTVAASVPKSAFEAQASGRAATTHRGRCTGSGSAGHPTF